MVMSYLICTQIGNALIVKSNQSQGTCQTFKCSLDLLAREPLCSRASDHTTITIEGDFSIPEAHSARQKKIKLIKLALMLVQTLRWYFVICHYRTQQSCHLHNHIRGDYYNEPKSKTAEIIEGPSLHFTITMKS